MSARLLLIGSAFLAASCATAQENPNYQHSSKYGQTQVADNGYASPYQSSQVRAEQVQTAGASSTQAAVYSDNLNQFDPQTGAQTYSAGTTQSLIHTHATRSGRSLTHTHAMEPGHSNAPAHTVDSGQVNSAYVGNEGTMIQATHPIENNTSPTERSYDTNQMQGTPGYEMMRAQQQAAPTPSYQPGPTPDYTPYTPPIAAAPAPRNPQPVTYDYGQNIVVTENAPSQQQVPNYEGSYDRGRVGTAANIGTGQSYIVRQGDTVYSLSRRLCASIPEITAPNGIDGSYAISIGQTLYLPTSRCP
jgi:hypothetical protein